MKFVGLYFSLRQNHLGVISRSFSVQIIGALITFIFTIACTKLLSTNEYGDIRYAMALLPIFMFFGLPGSDGIILKNSYLKKPINLTSVYLMRCVGGALGAFLLCLWILVMTGPQIQWTFSLWTVVLLLPFYDTATGFRNFLVGRGLKRKALDLALLIKTISFVSVVFLIILVSVGVVPKFLLFSGYLICLTIPMIIVFIIVARSQKYISYQDFSVRSFLSQSFFSSIAGLVGVLSASFDKIYLGHTLGNSTLALYSVLLMFPQEFARLTDTFVPLYYDRFFFNKNKTSLYGWAIKLFPVICLFFGIYGITFYFLSPFVFGPDYHYSSLQVFFSVLFLCTCVGEYFSFHRVFAQYSLFTYFLFLVAGLAVLFLLLTALTPLYGFLGILGSVIIKQVVMTAFVFWGGLDFFVKKS